MTTLTQLRDRTAKLFGDSRYRRVSATAVETAIVRGYNQFCNAVRALFEMHLPGDLANAGSYNFEFEADFTWMKGARATYSFPWERDHGRRVASGDPASISFSFEADHTTEAKVAALMELPEDLYQIERVTWDGRKLENYSSRAMGIGGLDNQYELIYGDVYAFILDKDGNRQLRRYRIPAAAGLNFGYIGRWGVVRGFEPSAVLEAGPRLGFFARMIDATTIYPPDVFISLSYTFGFSQASVTVGNGLTAAAPFTDMFIAGTRGVVRRVPGFHPSPRQWGIVRRLVFDSRNTRVEYTRRPHDPRTEGGFEIADVYLDPVVYWALSELYAKEGPMQDLAMAAHYKARYQGWVERAKVRMARTANAQQVVMGGLIHERRPGPPPLARPPANFPEGAFSRNRRRF